MREAEDLRVLIVDDELLARDLVREILESIPNLTIVGECGDGLAATEEIARLDPDLVLLDVQMPEVDGFDVLQRVGADAMPEVVFVTAHEQYTLRAFQVHALDFVLKPIDPQRLREAIAHARERIVRGRHAALVDGLRGLLEEVTDAETGGRPRGARRITVRKGDSIRFVALDDLDWLEAARNYVRLHAGEDSYLVRTTLKGLLRSLDDRRFLRIHRSAAINLERVGELRPLPGGDYAVTLRTGERLRASRTYADELLRLVH